MNSVNANLENAEDKMKVMTRLINENAHQKILAIVALGEMWDSIQTDLKAAAAEMDAAITAASAATDDNLKTLSDITRLGLKAEQLAQEYRHRSERYLGALLIEMEDGDSHG